MVRRVARRRDTAQISEALLRFGATRRRELQLDAAILDHVKRVIEACHGNKSLAAELMGIPRRTLQRWLARPKKKKRRR